MAGLKEIKRRLDSVRNTKKITYAMKLVAAAKLRKAQESVLSSRAYSLALNQLLNDLIKETGTDDFSHPLLEAKSQVKKVRLLVLGGSRGLCGGYNTNVNKKIALFLKEKAEAGIKVEVVAVSRKPAEYLRRTSTPILQSLENVSEDANAWPINEICEGLEESYIDNQVDEVHMIYTHFKSALSMIVKTERILPMANPASEAGAEVSPQTSGGILFEPSPAEVFEALVPRIIRSRVRQAALDAKASEYGSRMTAMEAATKNAGQLIHQLQLTHNKLRQSMITSQLLDILGGAEASN